MIRFLMNQFSKIQIIRPLILLAALTVACASKGQSANTTVVAAVSNQSVSPSGQELSWPREFQDGVVKVSIFKPQIEKWEGIDFETRSAVAVTPSGSNAPLYGSFWLNESADTA